MFRRACRLSQLWGIRIHFTLSDLHFVCFPHACCISSTYNFTSFFTLNYMWWEVATNSKAHHSAVSLLVPNISWTTIPQTPPICKVKDLVLRTLQKKRCRKKTRVLIKPRHLKRKIVKKQSLIRWLEPKDAVLSGSFSVEKPLPLREWANSQHQSITESLMISLGAWISVWKEVVFDTQYSSYLVLRSQTTFLYKAWKMHTSICFFKIPIPREFIIQGKTFINTQNFFTQNDGKFHAQYSWLLPTNREKRDTHT